MKTNLQLRIGAIEVKNFKSLVDFKLSLSKFTCLIGLNGVGKSTILQFLEFLSRLARGDIQNWLEERHWKSGDIRSKFLRKKNIEFCVKFQNDRGRPIGHWEAHFNPTVNRCTWERIELLNVHLVTSSDEVKIDLNVQNGRGKAPLQTKTWRSPISFGYEGSILSALKDKLLPPEIVQCRNFLRAAESLDMLTPERLRQRTRTAEGSLGSGGRNLSAFVYELGTLKRVELAKRLKKIYPSLRYVNASSLRSGWKELFATENFADSVLKTTARHLNDGMLRMIAILAEMQSDHGLLIFDEIENGINPELVEFVIDTLVNAEKQVVVTTHSPMILNYLEDDIASSGVIYLYKTPQGFTKSIPFFSIPSLAEKLTMMGPGEAFVDTNLSGLAQEIQSISEGR